MLNFQPITIKDKQDIERYLYANIYRGSDGSFANLFLWQHLYHTKFCIDEDFLYISGGIGGRAGFMCPFGTGDLKKALEKLKEYAFSVSEEPFLDGVTEDVKERIERVSPGTFVFEENRDDADYLYLSSDLSSLKGKRFHSKRTFVSDFIDEYYGRYEYTPITSQNMEEVRAFEKKWFEEYMAEEVDDNLTEELIAINLMFDYFSELSARGGVLMVDGKVIAYTMGTPGAVDTFVVQFEKADFNIPGAYQTINNFFSSDCLDYKYLNREDDMGLPNLRKAKLSYRPEIILMKYTANWKEGL